MFTEVQKAFEIHPIVQMTSDITVITEKNVSIINLLRNQD